MKMIKSPCKDCKDRCAGCHSFCSDWAQFEKAKQVQYARRRLESQSMIEPSKTMLRAIKEACKK